jgi:hypothetical protein
MATVIFSFCFFEMPVYVRRTADRHTFAALTVYRGMVLLYI